MKARQFSAPCFQSCPRKPVGCDLTKQSIERPTVAFGGAAGTFFTFEEVLDPQFAGFGELFGRSEIGAIFRDQFCSDP